MSFRLSLYSLRWKAVERNINNDDNDNNINNIKFLYCNFPMVQWHFTKNWDDQGLALYKKLRWSGLSEVLQDNFRNS